MADKKLLRVCRLLGDSTRLRIYDIVKSRPVGTTVKEVAGEVGLHPNVARLHLSKLEKEALVTSRSLPSRSKGRPQRLYLPGSAIVEISIPQRNYALLSKLLLGLVDSDDALEEKARGAGVEFGKRSTTLQSTGSIDDVCRGLARTLADLGFEPLIIGKKEDQIEIQTQNCIFKELVPENPALVCRLHHAITEGIARQLTTSDVEVSLGNYRCRQVVRLNGA